MLASIILECRRVLYHASAAVSSIRFVNNGPLSLMFALTSTFVQAGLWAVVLVALYCTTILLQFTSTTLVSDIGKGSLSGPASLNKTSVGMSFANLNQTKSRIDMQKPYWQESITNFPAFAEYQEPYPNQSYSLDGKISDGVRDTGLTHRVLLPFPTVDARTSMQSFSGAATVLDSRVVCARPKVHSGLSIALTHQTPPGTMLPTGSTIGYDQWALNGSISLTPEIAPPGLVLAHDLLTPMGGYKNGYLNFDLPPPPPHNFTRKERDEGTEIRSAWLSSYQEIFFGQNSGEWLLAQMLVTEGPRLVSSLDPRYSQIVENRELNVTSAWANRTGDDPTFSTSKNYFLEDDPVPLMTGRTYQVMNITPAAEYPTTVGWTDDKSSMGTLYSIDPSQPDFYGMAEQLVVMPENEWLVFTIASIPGWRVSISLCFDSFISADVKVNLTAEHMASEPILGPWNVSTKQFDTEAVRRQLGALHSTASELDRSILTLETTPEQLQGQMQQLYKDSSDRGLNHISFPAQQFIQPNLAEAKLGGVLMCSDCNLSIDAVRLGDYSYLDKFTNNSRIHNQIFQDTVQSANSITRAWQAYYTLLGRAVYYDMLSYFDIPDAPAIAGFQDVSFPRSSRGLILVAVVLCLHLLVVSLVTVYFVTKTVASRVGDNAWQSLTQARTKEMDQSAEYVDHATTSKDGDVKKWLTSVGLGDKTVSLKLGDADDNIVRLKRD